MDELDDRERDLLTGLVIAFGADRGRAQIVDRMLVRHGPLLRLLAHLFPRGALYGPYRRDGPEWMQRMSRGAGLGMRIDPGVLGRLDRMHAGARVYMAGVRAREAGTAHYRTPRGELTVAG